MKTNSNSGWAWAVIRDQKLHDNARDNDGRCEAGLDGCLGIAEEVHHVVSRVDGGGDDEGLLALCSACHQRFTTATIQEQVRRRKEAKREKQRRNHPGRIDRHG